MNKTAIKNFSIWARNKLIDDIRYHAGLLGITEDGIKAALPQSAEDTEFYDIGTAEPYSISGKAVRQRRKLVEVIHKKEQDSDYKTAYKYILEEVAYTWFNRLIAIRFMEVNDYLPSHIRVLSSDSGKLEPDIVTIPFDTGLLFTADEEQIVMQLKQDNQIDELFRMLFIKQCNALNEILPGLFEKTSDYTELLFSVSIIDQDGVVYHLIHDIDEDDFNIEKGGQVEIIGWLYQYWNTEPKDAVFGRPSGAKIRKEEIPAATQLFTPDWIVRYMVENSLGRLWVEGHPNDDLKTNWKYYLEEAEQEADVQLQLAKIHKEYASLSPEDIKCIDPCMGSGHILCYLFDVLMQIYESQGYSRRDAAQSILKYNLYGLDIDERAYQLAYFAVMMKARQYDRRILTRGIKPNVYAVCESNGISNYVVDYFINGDSVLKTAIDSILTEMYDAKEYGSLLNITLVDFEVLYNRFNEVFNDISLYKEMVLKELLPLVRVAEMLAQKYQVIVTNPPYMTVSNADKKMQGYVKKNFPDSKSDLFAVFIERCGQLAAKNSYQAMITQHSWMFLSSFEKLRVKLQMVDTVNMAHLGARAFEEIGGEVVQTTSFVMRKSYTKNYKGTYCRLIEPTTQQGKEDMFLTGENRYIAQQDNFSKIPGSPVAYWVSDMTILAYIVGTPVKKYMECKSGIMAGNEKYISLWFEVFLHNIKFDCKSAYDMGEYKWFPLNSGGDYRNYYGNNLKIIDLWHDGANIRRNVKNFRLRDKEYYFRKGITWGRITSSDVAFRKVIDGSLFGDAGPIGFVTDKCHYLLGFLCSKVCLHFLKANNPTLNYQVHDIEELPLIIDTESELIIEQNVLSSINITKLDWDSFETSWDFTHHPLARSMSTIAETYTAWESECETRFNQLKVNEEELNRIFIDIYGLQDELTPEIEDKYITVRKADLGRDIRSLLSYAIGCMFGRYSLDIEGLAYAGGEWDSSKYTSFIPLADGILPITDEEYLDNDIISLLCEWLKEVYGEETLEENLDFIAKALGNKGTTSREVIRNYFLKDFFANHCKIYQKRPIYWMFNSGKQNGFKALIYLHRYTPNTIGNLRIDYLHHMQRIYENEINRMQDMIDHSNNPREIAVATKRKEKLQKQLKECREYDEKISHLALSRIELDLDDGVKVNYRKIQTATDGKFYEVLADSKNIIGKK